MDPDEMCDGCGNLECPDKHLCDVVMPTTPIKPKEYTPEGRREWEQEMRDIYGEVAPPPLTLTNADIRPKTVYTAEVEAQVHRMYVTEGLTAKQVVEKMPQLTVDGVHQMAGRRGWRKGQKLRYDVETARRAFELHDQGLTYSQIAKEMGTISRHAAEKIISRSPRYRELVGR